jgi:hypothetical protein
VKISQASCSDRYATCSAVETRFEGKTHFAAPNAKNNTLIAFALGGNDNLSNVIDEEQYPGCVDLFVAGAMRTVQSVLIQFTAQEYRSTLGRTLSDRVGTFLAELPTEERDRLERQVKEHENDHWAKRAIALQNRVGTFYEGMGKALGDEMRASQMSTAKLAAAEATHEVDLEGLQERV